MLRLSVSVGVRFGVGEKAIIPTVSPLLGIDVPVLFDESSSILGI
jgi:hypothetical protein